MPSEAAVLALFAAGVLAGVWLLGRVRLAALDDGPGPRPDPRWPRPRRLRSKLAGGLTPGVVLSGLFVYCSGLVVLLDRDFFWLLALSMLPLAYAGFRRDRELDLLERGDLVEAEVHGSEVLRGRWGAFAGRSVTVSFHHAGQKVSSELYVARCDPGRERRVTLLVDPADSGNVLVYEDCSFRIVPPGAEA